MSAAVVAALAWRLFICRACGLVYDEALGDPDSGLAPGTRFEDIPDEWSCPLCGVTKADFEPHDARPPDARPGRHVPALRADPGIVIVGAGRAGWAMAAALREHDTRVPITVVAACDADAYDKPMLSVAGARDIGPAQWVREPASALADRLGVRLLARTFALRLDPATRRLRTTRGTLRYRALVLAHGAAPRALPQLPPDLCWRINDLTAYRRLRLSLGTRRRHVVVVGAGLVGCELANDLALQGHGVTLLDRCGRPLAAQLPARASERLLQAWHGLPLRFEGRVEVASLQRIEGMVCVTTVCGRSFEADQVIAATGLQAANELAAQAGLQTDADGVTVEANHLRTSDADIHALGDCASVEGRARRFIEPIGRQAQAIASALLGDGRIRFAPAQAVPLRIKTSSMPFTVQGSPTATGTWSTEEDDPAGRLRMVQRDGQAWVAQVEAVSMQLTGSRLAA